MSFKPHARRVEHTRRMAGALLRQDDVAREAVETVQLLVSEIVTNAVVHGNGDRVRFSLAYDPCGTVRIEVDDRSPARVAVRHPDPDEESGRGMFLVDALARDWGRRGTRTWCTVSVGSAREVRA
ncbi:ATP-binding protein [Streptomyces corynorhini]|uniref:ATP-binding protein n=2 Tax=Streptomyces corynorhini TaxID=2282652 RepID=A0A370AYD4_9ACTN|nr:ATP-binding protein [Streptomyces corynorhini]